MRLPLLAWDAVCDLPWHPSLPEHLLKAEPCQPTELTRGACSVFADHHIRRLDHRVGGIAGLEAERIHRIVRDGREDHDAAAHVDLDVRGGGAARNLQYLALHDVACAQTHDRPLPVWWGQPRAGTEIRAPTESLIASTWPEIRPSPVRICTWTLDSFGVKIPRCCREWNPISSTRVRSSVHRAFASSCRSGLCPAPSRLSRT